jgi:RimJ/RimL family protein N-acetyltransferase
MTYNPYEGKLVRLRVREPEDEPQMFRWFNDPEVTEHLTVRYPVSHKEEFSFIERMSNPNFATAEFAVETMAEGRLIGGAGLFNTSPEDRHAELGIALGDKTFWNGGYGTDTMRSLCRFGFDIMNLHRIQLDVYARNERAQHVYKKIGFQVEAVKRQAHFKLGSYHDVIVMGLLEGELVMGT